MQCDCTADLIRIACGSTPILVRIYVDVIPRVTPSAKKGTRCGMEPRTVEGDEKVRRKDPRITSSKHSAEPFHVLQRSHDSIQHRHSEISVDLGWNRGPLKEMNRFGEKTRGSHPRNIPPNPFIYFNGPTTTQHRHLCGSMSKL